MNDIQLLKLCNEFFRYSDGHLYWKKSPADHIKIGRKAGTVNTRNRARVILKGKNYSVSRLIFLMHNGYLPDQIDHKDCDTLNDKAGNLREASGEENARNRGVQKNNKCGVKGVYWSSRSKRWVAQIKKDGKRVYQKSFKSLNSAKVSITAERKKLHGEFARG